MSRVVSGGCLVTVERLYCDCGYGRELEYAALSGDGSHLHYCKSCFENHITEHRYPRVLLRDPGDGSSGSGIELELQIERRK